MAKHNLTGGSRTRKMALFKKMGWMTVGAILAARRKETKMTLEQVAAIAGTHKGYICGIEKGVLNPPAAVKLTAICQALGLGVESILVKTWVEKAPIQILPLLIESFRESEQPAFRRVKA